MQFFHWFDQTACEGFHTLELNPVTKRSKQVNRCRCLAEQTVRHGCTLTMYIGTQQTACLCCYMHVQGRRLFLVKRDILSVLCPSNCPLHIASHCLFAALLLWISFGVFTPFDSVQILSFSTHLSSSPYMT